MPAAAALEASAPAWDTLAGRGPPPPEVLYPLPTAPRGRPIPSWCPTFLWFEGRPPFESAAERTARWQGYSGDPDALRPVLALQAAAAQRGHRLRQRALAADLTEFALAASDPPALPTTSAGWWMALQSFLLDRLSSPSSASVQGWLFTLLPLLPAAPPSAEVSRFLRSLYAALPRCPAAPGAFPRPDLAPLLAETSRLGRWREWLAIFILSASPARGRDAFRAAAGHVHCPPALSTGELLITPAVEKTSIGRSPAPEPFVLPVRDRTTATAVRRALALAPLSGPDTAAFAAALRRLIRPEVADIRDTRRAHARVVAETHGRRAADDVLHHRPGSRHTAAYLGQAGMAHLPRLWSLALPPTGRR